MDTVTELTRRQECLSGDYVVKWTKKVLTRPHSNPTLVKGSINQVYQWLGYSPPQVYCFESVRTALEKLSAIEPVCLGKGLETEIERGLVDRIWQTLSPQISEKLWRKKLQREMCNHLDKTFSEPLDNAVWEYLDQSFSEDIWHKIDKLIWIKEDLIPKTPFDPRVQYSWNVFPSMIWASRGCLFDFCITVLGCEYPEQEWQLLQGLIHQCDYMMPYENICLIAMLSEAEQAQAMAKI